MTSLSRCFPRCTVHCGVCDCVRIPLPSLRLLRIYLFSPDVSSSAFCISFIPKRVSYTFASSGSSSPQRPSLDGDVFDVSSVSCPLSLKMGIIDERTDNHESVRR